MKLGILTKNHKQRIYSLKCSSRGNYSGCEREGCTTPGRVRETHCAGWGKRDARGPAAAQ